MTKKKQSAKALLIKDLLLDFDWTKHCEAVRSEIQKLDRLRMEAAAAAPFIVITNETRQKSTE